MQAPVGYRGLLPLAHPITRSGAYPPWARATEITRLRSQPAPSRQVSAGAPA